MRLSSVREGSWKLVLDHDSGRTRLFDLDADPGELHDLTPSQPERTRALRTTLDAWLTGTRREEGEQRLLSEEEKRHLEALGYL